MVSEVAVISATLVTIHGFWSSPATWERLNEAWGADEELSGLLIHPFGYPSPKKPPWPFSGARVPDYNDIAQVLATEFTTVLGRSQDLVVVTHSQGGLILQRFLAWMASEGRARELARIRSVVMLACPNTGSEYLKSVRRALGYGRHPQAGSLQVHDRQVADTQRTVLQRIVNATALDDYQCPIPFHVYAGASDDIVRAASAQASFPGASTIAGTHRTILDPAAAGNRTAETVKFHLLADTAAPRNGSGSVDEPGTADEPASAAPEKGSTSAKYVVIVNGAQGLQIGDRNIQRNALVRDAPEQPRDGAGVPGTETPGVSRPVTGWDAHSLGVHRAITASSSTGQAVPDLTAYVQRAHDARLRELLTSPARPLMVVLVGGSSTGKTRAAFEATRASLPDWSLLRPADAAGLLGGLRAGAVPARTVLWLNETQEFLNGRPDVAAALRDLLAGEEPVAVIGTTWPQFWKELTSRPDDGEQDLRYQARELLLHDAQRIDVPETFASTDLAELQRLAADPRLAAAAEAAGDSGMVIQVLAGGPELVHRYEHPADAEDRLGNAVVAAAMDARRLGQESPLGAAFLEKATPAYLSSPDRVGAPASWFATGLSHATREIRGIAALTGRREQPGIGPADGYVLHDYLDQHARAARRGMLIPAAAWDALIIHVIDPADRARLAQQAQRRGLYRYAVALARPAAEAGDRTAMQILAFRLNEAGHGEEAAEWMRRAAEAGDPVAVQFTAKRLDEQGDSAAAEAVLRTAAARGDASAILSLAGRLDQAGHRQEAERLLTQAAASGDTVVMGTLATRLNEEGRSEEAASWTRRAAEAGDIFAMQQVAEQLDKAGLSDEAETWLVRAAQLDDHFAHFVRTRLFQRLDEAGRADDAVAWLYRDIEAGETRNMWLLAARLEQAGRSYEASLMRQRARDAGEYFALYYAITEIEQAGGGLEEFEQLLRPPAAAGDIFSMQTLARKLDEAGRPTEANQWLRDMAQAGNLNALHVLAGRLEQANRKTEAEQVLRRIIELGNSAALPSLAQQLKDTDPGAAENLQRYGIEPGGSTAAPW